MKVVPDWAVESGLKPRQGVAGLAFAEQRPMIAQDYTTDDRFETTEGITAFVANAGIRAVLAAPLPGEEGPIGVISVVSRTPGVYREVDAELLSALATQASIALVNARLMQALEGSQAVIERRAGSEQALREIATRITAIREPGDLLQHVVEESARLLRADGALLELYDPTTRTLEYAFDAGLPERQRRDVQVTAGKLGEGVSGKAISERRVIVIDDYLTSDEFVHTPANDALAKASSIRSLIAAPIVGEDGPLGTIEVFRRKPAQFDQIDAAVLGGLADQAAVAITNARLIAELARSRAEIEHRAERERTLRDIAARIASLRDPGEVLERVVEEAKRLLGSDGAHLTRLDEGGRDLIPVVVAGGDVRMADWVKTQRFPLGEGINGLAARDAAPVWTADYLTDGRIPLEPDDVATAERLGLRGMAAAPLRSQSEGVIGTLAVSYAQPRSFDPEELDLLQGLADQAAIAITNAGLLERLTESERRYRHLVQNSPDMIWSIGSDATFTFLSDTCERLTGWTPDDLLGRHFGALVHASSQDVAELDWTATFTSPSQEVRGRVNLLRRDGSALPAEFTAMATLDADGNFVGVNGSVRDMTETDRLERELRDSEARFRQIVQTTPDVIWRADASGRFTFVADGAVDLFGWTAEEIVGKHFGFLTLDESMPEAIANWEQLAREPDVTQHVNYLLRRRDGSTFRSEIAAIGLTENGKFVGGQGTVRDISERERLERELRRQAGELASSEERSHLARELHDSVTQALFSMTLVARSVELLLERDPEAARTQLAQLRELQREALAEMRALIFELRPGNVEQDGLVRALRTHSSALQGRIGLPIVVESDVDDRLPLEIEETLYRIAQEALHNVVKHAAARQVRISLERARPGVRLRIEDDGKGFDPEAVPDSHLGIAGMRARAAKIGAQLECRSEPGRGTTIEVVVPDEVMERFPASSLPTAPTPSVR
jgi:PAS domain S-box-containing protein